MTLGSLFKMRKNHPIVLSVGVKCGCKIVRVCLGKLYSFPYPLKKKKKRKKKAKVKETKEAADIFSFIAFLKIQLRCLFQ